jgi:hypothetical protein
MTLDVHQLEDGCYKVCLSEDGITSCTVVSSMHLVEDKVPQLKRANKTAALEAFDLDDAA